MHVIHRGPCAANFVHFARHELWTVSSSLVLGHVLSPVRSLPRHSLLLIANYTSEPVCRLRSSAIFGKTPLTFVNFLTLLSTAGLVLSRRLVLLVLVYASDVSCNHILFKVLSVVL